MSNELDNFQRSVNTINEHIKHIFDKKSERLMDRGALDSLGIC